MKKVIARIGALALLLGLLAGCGTGSDETASVQSVAMITGTGSVGIVDCYAGKVVSGETATLQKDQDKTVLEVYVAEGDMVSQGDPLFSYDTEAMQLSLDKLKLEKENYENTISAAQSEISELESQKAKASSSQQLSYTLQINTRQADIREAEYNMALKEKEIATMEADMENADITSPISGRVMSVSDEDSTDYSSDDTAFITVMDVSSYRVEGQINELNLYSMTEGMRVVIRSRIDENQVWYGVIDSIDWENPVKNSSNSYYSDSGDDMTTASKYPFYVVLDDTDGLLLGQHVYIEPDYGQEETASGLMLPAYYVNDADGSAWVWAANAKGKLEKRAVTLGEYDSDLDEYEILSGLTTEDYIAFPEEGLSEGMAVVYYDESSFGDDEDYYDEWDEDYDYSDEYEEYEEYGYEDHEDYDDETLTDDAVVSGSDIEEGAVG
jgi:HlyD family secretion protein